VLETAGASFAILSHAENNPDGIKPYRDATALIQATPVGMYPDTGASPVSLSDFPHCRAVIDLIANPAKTALMLSAEEKGIPAFGGLSMLVAQAEAAHAVFTGSPIRTERIDETVKTIAGRAENVTLIGMPGCGKTTVGRILADRMGKRFTDTDEEIARLGRTPAEILRSDGEPTFREIEKATVQKLGRTWGRGIATGGGVVTVQANKASLRQNGRIVFINRSPDALATGDRPLSDEKEKRLVLFRDRLPRYRDFCDIEVDGNGSPEEVATRITEELAK
ncbi:MAG: shikimate kinase, partial [Ruminococcus sp.]|nr:shikimate kinase [Candidatus Apopatosoma intestinale]